jgi:hypothetical protein
MRWERPLSAPEGEGLCETIFLHKLESRTLSMNPFVWRRSRDGDLLDNWGQMILRQATLTCGQEPGVREGQALQEQCKLYSWTSFQAACLA